MPSVVLARQTVRPILCAIDGTGNRPGLTLRDHRTDRAECEWIDGVNVAAFAAKVPAHPFRKL